MNTKDLENSVGACYFAANCYGWGIGASPWEAINKLDFDSPKARMGSENWPKMMSHVNLIYLPDEKEFEHVENYQPVNKLGKPVGVYLYAGEYPHNEKVIKKNLSK